MKKQTQRRIMRAPYPGFDVPHLMTSKEVAEILRVDRSTLSRWRTLGTGPRVVWLSPGSPRYLRSDIDAWLQRVTS